MTVDPKQKDKANRKALEAVEGLLEIFKRMPENFSEGKVEDLITLTKLIKTQLLGAQIVLKSFIAKLEDQQGKTISENEAEVMTYPARAILGELGSG